MLYEVDEKLLDRVAKDMLYPKIGKMTTGLDELDYMTGGYERGQLVVLGGRPSMGKTAFALSMLNNVCIRGNHTCVYFTNQNSKESLIKRLICVNGKMNRREINGEKLDECAKTIGNASLWIDDTPVPYIDDIVNKCNEIRETQSLDYVFVDILQQVYCSRSDTLKTVEEQEEIIRRLKKLAEDLQCVVFVVSQLKRSADRRPGHYPKASDFEAHIALDKYADTIWILYRPGYYDHKANPRIANIFAVRSKGKCYSGTVLGYKPEYAAFLNYGGLYDVVTKTRKRT